MKSIITVIGKDLSQKILPLETGETSLEIDGDIKAVTGRIMYRAMSEKSPPQSVGQLLTDPRLYVAALGGAAVSKGVDAIRGTTDARIF